MLFNSLTFLVFAGLFFLLWPLCRRKSNLRWFYLTAASFLFYGWWDWRFLFLIVGSGLLDYAASLGMVAYPRARGAFMALSLFGNIGSLAIFKYSGFIAENLDQLFSMAGLHTSLQANIPGFMLILPVGISFYTFQSMSYTLDVYRGELKPTRNILHFMAYLSLFPQLVAGPIVRARDFLPQLCSPGTTDERGRWEGMQLIAHGFFKKMVIADNLGPVVDSAFGFPVFSESTVYWWFIITAFAFQIYCDFSGYSDIARGLAKWMGYRFEVNFNHPYNATSLSGFWSRWHISLSTWFRDYVYIPLGGSRVSRMRSHVNMWITMLVSGLWHGASWTFVVWGALHAGFMSLERVIKWPQWCRRIPRVGSWMATGIVIVQVWVAWVFFRADSLSQAVRIVRQMFDFNLDMSFRKAGLLTAAIYLAIGMLREVYCRFREVRELRSRPWLDIPVMVGMILACIFLRGPGEAFIYFQF